MTSPTSLLFDIDETLRLAIRMRASKEGQSEIEVVNGILRKALAAEVAEATGAVPLTVVIQNVVNNGQA